MGEMAEYMLNGDDCQFCGQYIGEGDGFPQSCGCDEEPKERDFSLFPVQKDDLEALENDLSEYEYDYFVKGNRDKKGQLMIGLKSKGKNAGLLVFPEDSVYRAGLKLVKKYMKGANNG